jgi:hypothetical protein
MSQVHLHLDLSGLIVDARLARGISTYLKHSKMEYPHLSARCDGSALLELATGLAPATNGIRRPLFQVVSPKFSVEKQHFSARQRGTSLTEIKTLD